MVAAILPVPKPQYFDNSGKPLVGGLIYTYAAGTSTPKATYADALKVSVNPNPVVLDAAGRATIYWDGSCRVEVRSALNVLIYSVDNFTVVSADQLRADLGSTSEGSGADLIPNAPKAMGSVQGVRALTSKTKVNSIFLLGRKLSSQSAFQNLFGGSMLQYDPTDTTTADNGVWCYVDTAGRRWKRDVSAGLNLLWHPDLKADCKILGSGVVASGSNAFSSAEAAFTVADVGKLISIKGAGPYGVYSFTTTIAAYVSATAVTLTTATPATSPGVLAAQWAYSSDDRAAAQSVIDAASALGTALGQMVKVFVPNITAGFGNFLIPGDDAGCIDIKSYVEFHNTGHLVGLFGDAAGHFIRCRSIQYFDIHGNGLFDAFNQSNDNCIATTNTNATNTSSGTPCAHGKVHDLNITGTRHGGAHNADPRDSSKVGSGGGKGFSCQFGGVDIQFYNITIDDCDIPWSVEGKESNQGQVSGIVVDNITARNCRFGVQLFGVINTLADYGKTSGMTIGLVQFYECANGMTLDAVPVDVSTLFGVVSTRTVAGIDIEKLRITNLTGTTTPLRGALRSCRLKFYGQVSTLRSGWNTAGYGGASPQPVITRDSRVDLDLTVLSGGVLEYLFNNDATNFAIRSIVDCEISNIVAGSPVAVPIANYTQNLQVTTLCRVHDKGVGTLYEILGGTVFPGAPPANYKWQSNGLAARWDEANSITRIAPVSGSSGLSLDGPAGGQQALVETSGLSVARLKFQQGNPLTIAAGVITITHSHHRVDTEGGAAADDLDTITPPANFSEGILIIRIVSDARQVVVRHTGGGTGNIRLNGATNKTLNSANDRLMLMYTGTLWVQMDYSDN